MALPDPALYGQFQNLDDVDIVLNGLLELGFDQVYEARRGCRDALRLRPASASATAADRAMPEISSACPAVIRLISHALSQAHQPTSPRSSLPAELAAITGPPTGGEGDRPVAR